MNDEELAKQEALERIRAIAAQNHINPSDLQTALSGAPTVSPAHIPTQNTRFDLKRKLSLTELLYYIGGGIVVAGIGILISQNWTSLSSFTKILVTLGTGALAYLIAVLLQYNAKTHSPSIAFHTIAALVLPLGLFVTFNLSGADIGSAGIQSLIFSILLAMYLASLLIFGQSFFLLFSIIYGSALYYSLTNTFITTAPTLFGNNVGTYRDLILGSAIVLIGYGLRKSKYKDITGIAYFFGVLIVLESTFILGGFQPNQNIVWELIFPILAFGAIMASVPLKSRSFMIWGTLSLMGYIFKITSEYFASSLGWPLALIIAGFAIIGAAAGAISLRRKYSRN